MSDTWILNRTSITGGIYRGLLVGAGEPPALEMTMEGESLGHLTPAAAEGGYHVEGELGTALLTDGVHTVVVRAPDGTALDSITIVTGLGAPEDIRAEMGALRDELRVLKAAFRRHINES
ncbi:MAG: hypothetical protein WBA02_12290 [Jannaschia helgolandensis]|jgi:hypothetical protein|uniref:Uncharacterized protein n=1 Tax=Jannaschia helgolandensis TaxID=188906 RepID=A0A1H7GHF4_9RHOB|nr:hypothetical protein [Jannaschia helgolandensis]SEK35900.1 hypothetical protein SAMN04488526_0375 [Jannaschia helgolandensis]